jgi:hypothetical protein
MNSVFITSEMSVCVPQTIHSTIYSHMLKFNFPIQLICFLCGTWRFYNSNTDTQGNHRANTLNYSYTVSSILQSMLIALCNKIQFLLLKGESIYLTMLQLGSPYLIHFKNHIHHVLIQIMIKRTVHTIGKTQMCKISCQLEEDLKIPQKKTLYSRLAEI